MGAWGVLAFDNDEACDWASDLDDVDDLSLVEAAFKVVEDSGGDCLDAHDATDALAACEVLARLRGEPGYNNAYTEGVDAWVAAHPIDPQPRMLARAEAVIARVLGKKSELRELWDDGVGAEWREAVDDLRRRLRA
ncbi:MAG: hypothetical protein JWN40_1894 [Phycisphaerales bacterium]|nr:hypothetical protein [Phycisphaerales bacterium]